MTPEDSRYCINCGAKLEEGHRFCWSCGAPRWPGELGDPPGEPSESREAPATASGSDRPPPSPGVSVFGGRPAAPAVSPPNLGLLPWLYAAGAIVFLVEATQGLAYLLSPGGRAQLMTELAREGVAASIRGGVVSAYWVVFISASLVAAALHGAAFYGLRRFRRWGWISAVIVASLWSLLVVGIPVLLRLVNRDVRGAFGVD